MEQDDQPIASTSFLQPSVKKKPITSSRVARYRFDPSVSLEGAPPPSQQQLDKREALAKRIIGSSASLLNRKSQYLEPDEYSASREAEDEEAMEQDEALGQLNEEEEEEEVPVKGKGKGKAAIKGEGEGKEVDIASSRFSKFAAKDSGKGKGKEVAVKYTPLEQQVLALKKANPGVVLMIEVGRVISQSRMALVN